MTLTTTTARQCASLLLGHAALLCSKCCATTAGSGKPRAGSCFGAVCRVPVRPQVLDEKRSAARFGVPVGALVTPVPSCEGLAPLPLVRGRAPVVCSECGAFVNLYCKVPPRRAPHRRVTCSQWCHL